MNARPHYIINIVEALRTLGGTGTFSDVYQWIDENGRIRHEDKQKSDFWRRREVRFSKEDLRLAGFIISPKRGIWSLTEIGLDVEINEGLPRLVNKRKQEEKRKQEALARQQDIPKDVPYTCDFEIENHVPQPTTGPQPTPWSSRITRTIGNESGVYIMKFDEHDLWKIGYTKNLETRIRDINRHIPYEILNKQWTPHYWIKCADEQEAYDLEQLILSELKDYRTIGERLLCSKQCIDDALKAMRTL